jgi:polyisoprenyl-phosphate glycosyltransferase
MELSRNFGHQPAVTAGFEIARGNAIILMDADLQDPPEVIPEMIKRWREGCDVAYGQRIRREGETPFKKISAHLFYHLFRQISHMNLPIDTGEFRLMDRKVIEALKTMQERQRFLRGMVTWIGFRQTVVKYAREARKAGRTHYPLKAMIRLAWDAFASFTSFPIHCLYYAGTLALGLGIVLAIVGLGQIHEPRNLPLFLALTGVLAMVAGLQLYGMGILGEYISRTYEETKKRPLYIVRKIHRAASSASPA